MTTRRDLLRGSGALMTGTVLAGCTLSAEDSDLFASFFTLAEFTRAVAGDAYEVENAVPTGGHGHGWTPSVDMLPSIVESQAFVYLDIDGFQPWAREAAEQVRDEHEDEVLLVDALAGIELLEYDGHGGHSDGDDHDDEIGQIHAIELIDRSIDQPVGEAHGNHWHGGPPDVPLGEHVSLGAVVTDEDGVEVPLGDDTPYALDARVENGGSALDVESHGDHVHLHGEAVGTVDVVFQLVEDGEPRWEAPPATTTVGASDDGDDAGHSDTGHGHDDDGHDHDHTHGEHDAKFFTDPLRAKQGIRNIRDALVELDPENTDSYEANAAAYIERLDDLHEQYEKSLADREHDVVVIAGHDSFRYLGDRYGFEIHTPVGLSPDHEPAPDEIAETVGLVEDQGIDCILWDYFDGNDIATVIADEADHEVDIEMVSPAESVTQEWDEEGVGSYLSQMEEINLPAFAKALGAK